MSYTLEQFEKSGESREAVLKTLYDYAVEYLDLFLLSGEFDRLYCIAPDDDGSATVIIECTSETAGQYHRIGTKLSEDSVEYSCLNEILQQGYVIIMILKCTRDKEKDLMLYAAYSPVYKDGKLCYVIFAGFDWSSFANILRRNLETMIVFGIIGMVISNAVLIIFIYFIAVKPVSKVTAGVHEYMESK